MKSFDVIVIGSGPGGYVAAIRCAQLGMSTAIIEKYSNLGGTCLNVGCIPSKALLESSEHFFKSNHEFKTHGIELGSLKMNFTQTMQRKEKILSEMHMGLDFLMKKNNITVFNGTGSFVDKNTIAVSSNGKGDNLTSKNIIIATGSKPFALPSFNFLAKALAFNEDFNKSIIQFI